MNSAMLIVLSKLSCQLFRYYFGSSGRRNKTDSGVKKPAHSVLNPNRGTLTPTKSRHIILRAIGSDFNHVIKCRAEGQDNTPRITISPATYA